MTPQTEPGHPHPLGATVADGGVNFAVFSQHADQVELLLFDRHDAPAPYATLPMQRTFHYWHAFVPGLGRGAAYAFRAHGPNDPAAGLRFNPSRVLIDPYARGNTDSLWRRVDACPGDGRDDRDNVATSMRSVVIDRRDFDWGGDRPLARPMADSIIYEMHVGGFTRHPSSGVARPGTFLAVVEKIPYLASLGVTAVELLPVFDFDETDVLRVTDDGTPLRNYWGYSTMGFFAPQVSYCVSPQTGAHVDEFRTMVKALHAAGIEVILDVVFNHTDEGNHRGPTFSFRGLDNLIYYYLVNSDKQYYMDYTGCGNTFNCNHPIPAKLIVECLEYWVQEMHVDGFRFDEGTVLVRDVSGRPSTYGSVIWDIELSETLADTKLIAEAWDAAGEYAIGRFPGYRWAEWNGRFRDDLRRFVRGDAGLAGAIATRMSGSSDLYQASGHQPVNSINFVVCHDGFTLNDLVSYNGKHNLANGEGNRDGSNDNLSWNCGVEGPSDDPGVEALRERQIRNLTTVQFLSQGVPMITAGDEVRRTQRGNNNAYCQDNEISWFDWDLVGKNAEMLAFFQNIARFRLQNAALRRSTFFDGSVNARGVPDLTWHGTQLDRPDWSPGSRTLAFTLGGHGDEPDLHAMVNMHWEDHDFELPTGRTWKRAVDTSLPGHEAVRLRGQEPVIQAPAVRVAARSVVVAAAG
jgi:glycogen operon protein